MRVPRQQISFALYSLLANSYPWATANPRLAFPDDLGSFAQPALFLVKPKENITQSATFQLPIYRLKYYAFMLVRAAGVPEDPNNTAEQVVDNLLDSIESAMMPTPGQYQTLGGLVTHTWIDGDIGIDTPVLFPQCAVWIPITVLVGA